MRNLLFRTIALLLSAGLTVDPAAVGMGTVPMGDYKAPLGTVPNSYFSDLFSSQALAPEAVEAGAAASAPAGIRCEVDREAALAEGLLPADVPEEAPAAPLARTRDDAGLPFTPGAYILRALGLDGAAPEPALAPDEEWQRRAINLRPDQVAATNAVFLTSELQAGARIEIIFRNGEAVAIVSASVRRWDAPEAPAQRQVLELGADRPDGLPASLKMALSRLRMDVVDEPAVAWSQWLGEPVKVFKGYTWDYMPELGRAVVVFRGVFPPGHNPKEEPSSSSAILADFPDVRGLRVLDAGAGTAVLALKALLEGAEEAVAFDSNILAVWCARYNARLLGFSGRLRVIEAGDAAQLPSDIGFFDLILSNVPSSSEIGLSQGQAKGQAKLMSALERRNISDPNASLLRTVLKEGAKRLRPGRAPAIHLAAHAAREPTLDKIARHIGWTLRRADSVENRDHYVHFVLTVPALSLEFSRAASGPRVFPVAAPLPDQWPDAHPITAIDRERYAIGSRQAITAETLRAALRAIAAALEEIDKAGLPKLAVHDYGAFSLFLSAVSGPNAYAVELAILANAGETARDALEAQWQSWQRMMDAWRRGQRRFIPAVFAVLDIPTPSGRLFAALLSRLDGFDRLHFHKGRLWRRIQGVEAWEPVGLLEQAHLLAEWVAALVYHYEPDEEGGATLTDVWFNEGDVAATRGGYDLPRLRLRSLRGRRTGVDRNAFLAALLSLVAYEAMIPASLQTLPSWLSSVSLRLPARITNASVVFEGLRRGLSLRAIDLKTPNALSRAAAETDRWLAEFAATEAGLPFRNAIAAFRAGELPLAFGAEPGEQGASLEELGDGRKMAAERRARLGITPEERALYDAILHFIDSRLARVA